MADISPKLKRAMILSPDREAARGLNVLIHMLFPEVAVVCCSVFAKTPEERFTALRPSCSGASEGIDP